MIWISIDESLKLKNGYLPFPTDALHRVHFEMSQFYLRLPTLKRRFKPEATCERLATFSDNLKGAPCTYKGNYYL